MMKVLVRGASALTVLLLAACFRIERHDLQLQVPGLVTERDLVLATNAAQHELMGELPDAEHYCEIDLKRSLLVYHEGAQLRDPRYVSRLLTALRMAGYPGTVQEIRHNPTRPIRVSNYPNPVVVWPDRHTLVVQIPELHRNLDANRVADALAYGRAGARLERLRVDPVARTIIVAQQNRRLGTRTNYAYRIATAGVRVEGWPEPAPGADPPARGWQPLEG